MLLNHAFDPGARLRGLLALLLLTLGLLAGVTVSRSQQVIAQQAVVDEVMLPVVKQVHALSRAVDEQRGMAALHLLLRSAADRDEVERRLSSSRQRAERLMAAFGQRLVDDTDRSHHRAVLISLASFWSAQDRVLAASRRAPGDAAAAALARELLGGESQQAYHQVSADLDAWWAYTEDAAVRSARLAKASAQQLLWLAGGAAALVVLALLGLLVSAMRRPGRPAELFGRDTAAARLDGSTLQQHLRALNAAVTSARRGEPGRAAGLSAQEARQLADQVDAAACDLRELITRPAAEPATRPTARGERH